MDQVSVSIPGLNPSKSVPVVWGVGFWWVREDPWKSPKRCVPALDFPYLDFFPEFYPNSGRYPKIFGPYPDSDIYLKKKIFEDIFANKMQ